MTETDKAISDILWIWKRGHIGVDEARTKIIELLLAEGSAESIHWAGHFAVLAQKKDRFTYFTSLHDELFVWPAK